MKRLIQAIGVLLALFQCNPTAKASIIQLDGYAQVGIVLISPDRIVCSKSASGQKQSEMFCLDSKTRQVVWRLNVPERTWNGTADGASAFYHISGDVLFKRSLNTGQVIWQTPLASIPAQKSLPIVTLGEKAEILWEQAKGKLGLGTAGMPAIPVLSLGGAGGTPNFFSYHGPFASGSKLILCRDASHHSGCVVSPCFHDWLVIDPVHGRHLGGGDGELLGTLNGTCLIGGPNSRIIANAVPVRFMELERLQGIWPESRFWAFGRTQPYENGGRCLVPARSGNNDTALLIGKSGHEITVMAATDRANYQCQWVLLKDRVLRFSEGLRATNDGPPNKDFKRWFELYGLDGKLERTVEWPETGVDAVSYWSWLGITVHDDLVTECGDEIFVITIPEFRVATHYTPRSPARFPENAIGRTTLHFVTGSDDMYQIWGGVSLMKMDREEVTQPVGIRLLNVHTGQPVWEYSETVTIRKITR